ncbi:hypothetical protein C9J85_18370 [Haloferax sp. wsp5]|nr:hypothetical protein C9J85_18370 [Haloferax sp. wsp5]
MLGTSDELDDPIHVLYVNSRSTARELRRHCVLVQTKLQQTSTEIEIAEEVYEALQHCYGTTRRQCNKSSLSRFTHVMSFVRDSTVDSQNGAQIDMSGQDAGEYTTSPTRR